MDCKSPYGGDPGKSLVAEFRFLLPDKGPKPFFTDAEIQFLLERAEDDVDTAVLTACELLVNHFAACVDMTVGKVRVNYGQRYKHWKERCDQLKRCAPLAQVLCFTEPRNCVPKPAFELGQDDYLFNASKHLGEECCK